MDTYSVPQETQKLLLEGIIDNNLHASAPAEIKEAAKHVEIIGENVPCIPINWRFAESISAIKAFEAAMVSVLLKKKYGKEYQKVVINTDHAQLFVMSPMLPVVDRAGEKITIMDLDKMKELIPDGDKFHASDRGHLKATCTNIYKTKDGKYYHLHSSLDAAPTYAALGIPPSASALTHEEGCAIFQSKVLQYTASEIEALMNDTHRQAGTICHSISEYQASEHGKANAHVGLFEVHHIPNHTQAPGWWTPVQDHTNSRRPLFGLKVVDLTRIIASPAITRGLAELGASVMRITSPHITDMTVLALDLGWGKWNAYLDLTSLEDRKKLRTLIEEADVVVDGYRPGVMKKWGFGKDDVLGFFKEKGRGVVYVRENCYGWNGPWMYRSGWQQISDANTGTSLEFGRAMGNDEPVTPVFPNADFCAGVSGTIGVLQALIEKAEKGGSYVVDVALNYYSQWLTTTCGTYPQPVWDALWSSYNHPVLRHTDNMAISLLAFMKMLRAPSSLAARLFDPEFFEIRRNGVLGVNVKTVKPVLQFPEGTVELGYNVGSRGDGVDEPVWPDDLLAEVVCGRG